MRYNHLPTFQRGIQVSAVGALQDNLRLHYGGWVNRFDSDAVPHFVAGQIALEQHPIPRSAHGRTRQIFNEPSRRNLPSTSIQLTRRLLNDPETGSPMFGLPLATGTLEFNNALDPVVGYASRTTDEPDQNDFRPSHFNVSATLSLNPTRMLNHQSLIAIVSRRNDPDVELGPMTYMTRRRGIQNDYEFELGDGDNVLIENRPFSVGHSPLYRRLRSQYLRVWDELIDERLSRYISADHLYRAPRFSLSYVENYFEFQCENPILAIEELRPHIRALGRRNRNMNRRSRIHDEYIDGNEIGYVVDLARGVELAIYAKTNRRVRVEARTQLSEREQSADFPMTSHAREGLSEIEALIEVTAADATTLINQALGELDPGLPGVGPNTPQSPPYELLREIMRAVSDQFRDVADNAEGRRQIASSQDLLISLIIHRNGCSRPSNKRLAAAVESLQRRGVLEAPNSGRIRRLSSKYQNARRLLYADRHHGNMPSEDE